MIGQEGLKSLAKSLFNGCVHCAVLCIHINLRLFEGELGKHTQKSM